MPKDKSDPQRGYTVPAHPSDIDQAIFMGDVQVDNMHSAFLAMATEIWSLRRRQKVVEALLASRHAITTDMIETYRPSAEQEADWQRDRDLFIRAIYDPLQRRAGVAYHEAPPFDPAPVQPALR